MLMVEAQFVSRMREEGGEGESDGEGVERLTVLSEVLLRACIPHTQN
jgi:hypothetical protein